jgi:hypothetical protein
MSRMLTESTLLLRADSGFCYVYLLKGARPVWRHEDLCAVDLWGHIGVSYLHKVRRPTGTGWRHLHFVLTVRGAAQDRACPGLAN